MSRNEMSRFDYRDNDPSAALIEQRIAGLRSSIAPGVRYRDKVLRSVADSSERECRKSQTAKVIVAMSLLLIAMSPMISALTKVEHHTPQTADRANCDALELAEQHRLSFDWALVDVFARFRDDTSAAMHVTQ